MEDKVVVIHQPDFMPYMGFFDRLVHSDVYVVLDQVQFEKNSKDKWTNRDQIKTKDGARWITVGVKKSSRDALINQVELSEEHDWRNRHLNMIKENYRNAPYFYEIYPIIEEIYRYKSDKLVDFNMNALEKVLSILDISIGIVYASSLGVKGHSNQLLINIIKQLDCKYYLSGVGAKAYCDEKLFQEEGIKIMWQDYKHPIYEQQYEGFIPYLSILDVLFNCGIVKTQKIIKES